VTSSTQPTKAAPSASGASVQADTNAASAATSRAVAAAAPADGAAMAAPAMATQPGTLAYDAATNAALAAAKAALPKTYQPRTRHYDGKEHTSAQAHPDPYAPVGAKPNYTNRLLLETSPYLRQHAHNPVDWRPWGPAAFAEARALGRPIFLSVGYSTCHWCHVMEHQSFEDLEIAQALNTMYVPIKVDREERPDVDAVYMAAVHAMAGNGGWPMSVWIAPGPGGAGAELAGLPYFAGTYFPPRGGGGRRPGFLGLIRKLAEQYAEDKAGIVSRGQAIAAQIRNQMGASWAGDEVGVDVVDRLAADALARFDPVHGGSARAPKFPSNVPYAALLRHHLRTGDSKSRHVALFSLDKMSQGGIYDHVGGGFARYSTDARWLVPHFEKMLYDQALIGRALVEAYTLSGEARYARTLRETLDYLLREMRAPSGAFYSATDADSEGKEGKFFVWTVAELNAALGEEDGAFVASVYNATAAGNFEGSNILHLRDSLEALAAARKARPEAFIARARGLLDKLYTVRSTRVPPLRDDKVLTAWNGLHIGTLAQAGVALDAPVYVEAARKAAAAIMQIMHSPEHGLRRSALDGRSRHRGTLDDYAFFIGGLLDLYEATGDHGALANALMLQRELDAGFADPRGGYFATHRDAEALLAREKPDYDGAEPSGNSIAAQNLVRLASLTGDEATERRARATISAFSRRVARYPIAMSELLTAVEMLAWPMREVVLVRPAGSDPSVLAPMRAALRGVYQPHRVVVQVQAGEDVAALARLAPIVAEKVARKGAVTAYVCTRGACKLPTTDPAEMVRHLKERKP
jgi:uncharacterized protein YyaL (SSP411 family)